jgi:hypothetical protein
MRVNGGQILVGRSSWTDPYAEVQRRNRDEALARAWRDKTDKLQAIMWPLRATATTDDMEFRPCLKRVGPELRTQVSRG